MNGVKIRRQRAIAQLIRSNVLASQDYLVGHLADLGFSATQATISRDLEQLGAVKLRRNGTVSYALPEEVFSPARDLASVIGALARTIEPAGNIVVIKTPPGSAHLVGVALDTADLADVVGTVCGDDTIFVACRGRAAAKAIAAELGGQLLRPPEVADA